jgi:hypothetical protein
MNPLNDLDMLLEDVFGLVRLLHRHNYKQQSKALRRLRKLRPELFTGDLREGLWWWGLTLNK